MTVLSINRKWLRQLCVALASVYSRILPSGDAASLATSFEATRDYVEHRQKVVLAYRCLFVKVMITSVSL